MFKFGQIEIAAKEFHAQYEVARVVDPSKIAVSEGVLCNKSDVRFTIGYEMEPGKIVPLYIKTPKDCSSTGVTRYNESSPWKMGFNVSSNSGWRGVYEHIWSRVEELVGRKLSGAPLNNGKYVNPKLISWEDTIKTRFNGVVPYGKYCDASGVLKIGSVYKQGDNLHLQVFLKECKYRERDVEFVSALSDDEA